MQFLVATSDREALCTLESYKYYKYKYDFYQSTAPQLKHEIFHSDCLGGVDEIVQKTPKGRWEKLTQGASSFRSLPPSPGAAIMQVRKAIQVAPHIWGKAHLPMIEPPNMFSITQGWKMDNEEVQHIWTATLEPADGLTYSKVCKTKCGCRKKEDVCQGRCKCNDSELSCLFSCKCRRRCVRNSPENSP